MADDQPTPTPEPQPDPEPMTTAEEYKAIRLALQAFASGQSIFSYSIGDLSITYASTQQDFLVQREAELARRLTLTQLRKRTAPDFT